MRWKCPCLSRNECDQVGVLDNSVHVLLPRRKEAGVHAWLMEAGSRVVWRAWRIPLLCFSRCDLACMAADRPGQAGPGRSRRRSAMFEWR